MTDAPDPQQVANDLAGRLAAMMEGLAPILEISIGYKSQCVDAGFTVEDASRMAADLHGEMVRVMFAGS